MDTNEDLYDNLTVMAVTEVFPAGTHSVGIDCRPSECTMRRLGLWPRR